MGLADAVSTDEEWEDSAAARTLLLVTGGMMVFVGFRFWGIIEPQSIVGAAVVIGAYAVAAQLMVFGATGVDAARWGRWIGAAVAIILTLATFGAIIRASGDALPRHGTDAMLFSRYSTDLFLAGENPYTHSMAPAIRDAHEALYATPRIDGTIVDSLSYPAGAVLAFVPQAATVGAAGIGLRLTLILATLAAALLLINDAPAQLSIAGIAVLIAGRNWWVVSAGGVIDMLWILPVLLAMRYWYAERWSVAAVWMGIACGIKQQPWFMLPFLAAWVWQTAPTWRAFGRRAAATIGPGVAAFLALNLPFIAWDPGAWLGGVLTPVTGSAPMVHHGVGLSVLTWTGLYALPTWWHALAVGVVGFVALVAYSLWFGRLKWAAWVIPVALLFVNYRSLNSYFTAFLPIAFYAILCQYDVVDRGVSVPAPLAEWVGRQSRRLQRPVGGA
jgi:uncharacterized membrane protein